MPVFLERFVLALLVAIFGGTVLNNMFSLDWQRRTALGLAVVALAYFVGLTIYRDRTDAVATKTAHTIAPEHPAVSAPNRGPEANAQPASKEHAAAKKERPLEEEKSSKARQTVGNVHQSSTGPNSPNVATFGPNSPVTINQGLAPWSLSQPQQAIISEAVRPHRNLWDGQFDVVTCNFGDPDSARMAEAIVAAFRSAGWALPHGGYGQALSTPTPIGIVVNIPGTYGTDQPAPEIIPFLRDFGDALRNASVISGPLAVGMVPTMQPGTFNVRIGRRPD